MTARDGGVVNSYWRASIIIKLVEETIFLSEIEIKKWNKANNAVYVGRNSK